MKKTFLFGVICAVTSLAARAETSPLPLKDKPAVTAFKPASDKRTEVRAEKATSGSEKALVTCRYSVVFVSSGGLHLGTRTWETQAGPGQTFSSCEQFFSVQRYYLTHAHGLDLY
ncbi:hypothetical protein ACTJIJ_13195 [Niabella sp. 22666]|uniref:hypothetical protein n=1 Tax=Niabella sp. 22666 TaxID=3453954 RepID=UPI003F8738CA